MAEYPFKDFITSTDDDKQALFTAPHVMTEGGVWIPQRGSDDGAAHTQQTGSKVESEKLIERDIYSGNITNNRFNIPSSAKRFRIDVNINAITGDLSDDGGLGFQIYLGQKSDYRKTYARFRPNKKLTDVSDGKNNITLVFGDGLYSLTEFNADSYLDVRNGYKESVEIIEFPLLGENYEVRFDIIISGNFEVNEGFDLQAKYSIIY